MNNVIRPEVIKQRAFNVINGIKRQKENTFVYDVTHSNFDEIISQKPNIKTAGVVKIPVAEKSFAQKTKGYINGMFDMFKASSKKTKALIAAAIAVVVAGGVFVVKKIRDFKEKKSDSIK